MNGQHDTILLDGLLFEPMISSAELLTAVGEIAGKLTSRHAGARPLMVCVLAGAEVFHADLIRHMPIPLETDFVLVSSYAGMKSAGNVRMEFPGKAEVNGRCVVIVEDIVDTGRTTGFLRRHFSERGAKSVDVVSLLFKPTALQTGMPPEYACFRIPDRFVIGYGLDYNQLGRNLPAIYALREPADS